MDLKGTSLKRYSLMMMDVPVLDFLYDPDARRIAEVVRVRELGCAPLPIWNARIATIRDYNIVASVNRWWSSRGIPESRRGIARTLREMGAESPRDLAAAALGLSLTDQYWIKPDGFEGSWKDVNFFENPFDDRIGTMLAGGAAPEGASSPLDPSAVTDGNLPKMWTIGPDGARILLKAGSGPIQQEPFNEAAATELYRRILPPSAFVPYDLVQGPSGIMSRCPCMVDAVHEFVPANHIRISLAGGTGTFDPDEYLAASEALGIEGTPGLLDRMLATDFLIGNWDRHGGNFGAIRNSATRKFEGCAPLFDAAASLLCDAIGGEDRPIESIPANPFLPRQYQQLALVRDFSWFDPEAARRGTDAMAAILTLCPNRYMDSQRVAFLKAFLDSGVSTIEYAAQLPPAKNLGEAIGRSEKFKLLRNEKMVELAGTAAMPAETRPSPSETPLPTVGRPGPPTPARALEAAREAAARANRPFGGRGRSASRGKSR